MISKRAWRAENVVATGEEIEKSVFHRSATTPRGFLHWDWCVLEDLLSDESFLIFQSHRLEIRFLLNFLLNCFVVLQETHSIVSLQSCLKGKIVTHLVSV